MGSGRLLLTTHLVGADALIGPPFDRYILSPSITLRTSLVEGYILSQVEGLTVILARSGNGPY